MANDSIQWLVRKRNPQGYEVTGPFSTKQIQSMMHTGNLEPDHELCPENHYWFSFYEKNEVTKFFDENGTIVKPEITKPDIVRKRSFFRFDKGDFLRLFLLLSAAVLLFIFLKTLKNLKP